MVLISSANEAGPSTSTSINNLSDKRNLKFNVQHRDTVHKITISDQSTMRKKLINYKLVKIKVINYFLIDDLKQLVMDRTTVPVCRQQLKGFPLSIASQVQNGKTSLKSLKLPDENDLELADLSLEGITEERTCKMTQINNSLYF